MQVTSSLTESVHAWRARGRFLTIAGRSLFVVDAGPRHAPPVLLLHGFPSSSHDFHQIVPALERDHRVIAFDLPGFGLSDKPTEYSYSLVEQAEITTLLLRHLAIHTTQIVAHDMGTSVASELLALRERGLLPFEVDAVVLMNGSVHIELAQLTPSQKLLRSRFASTFVKLSSRKLFGAQIHRIVSRSLPESALDDMWCLMNHKDGLARLPQTISYVAERTRFWHRWVGALTRLDVPALVLWGPEDTVAVMAIGERLASEIPGARLERLEGLGHYPQLEDPERVGSVLSEFLRTARPRQPMPSQPALLR
ncbi:MAG: alpha/beta hydrolase [Polyangiaceae bacterium]|nr:alpha/beta hydrolase [Polyangiaceae bacterium]